MMQTLIGSLTNEELIERLKTIPKHKLLQQCISRKERRRVEEANQNKIKSVVPQIAPLTEIMPDPPKTVWSCLSCHKPHPKPRKYEFCPFTHSKLERSRNDRGFFLKN